MKHKGRALAALLVALALGALAVALGLWWYRARHRSLTLATGQVGGVYHPVGLELQRAWSAQHLRWSVDVRPTSGAIENLRLLEEGAAQLGIVTNDSPGSDRVRLIAPLFQEDMHLVVHRGSGIASLTDLRARRVSLGVRGSATAQVSEQLLTHFDVPVASLTASYLTHGEAVRAFRGGELDAVFILGGLRMAAVDELVHTADATLVSLGDAGQTGSALEGIRIDAPFLSLGTIPQGTYGGEPRAPIGTVSVLALLVARDDVPERQVYELTRTLFAGRAGLAHRLHVLSRMSEQFESASSPFPLHPGAEAYYRRNDPPFVSRYANELSLGLTMGALVWSAFTGLNAWRTRRRKGRIEEYFVELHALGQLLEGAGDAAALDALQRKLDALRARALQELASERLDASESFAIFQRERETLERGVSEKRARVQPQTDPCA